MGKETEIKEMSNAELQTQVTLLSEKLEQVQAAQELLSKENTAYKKAIKTEQAATKPAPPPVIPSESFKIGKKEYKFVIPAFRHNGVTVSATDALTDEAILQHLADTGSGAIQEVE